MPRPPVPVPELDEVLLPCAQAWQGLRGKRVFITGGTGTVGIWMLELFCRANALWNLGAGIQALSRNPQAFRERCPHLAADPAVSLLEGDVRSFGPLDSVDLAIHGAADASGSRSYDDLLGHLDTLVLGTRHALERLVEAKAGRVLILSSGAVYGPQPPDLERVDETFTEAPDGLNPGTRYAQGKRMAEHYGAVFQHQFGLEAVIARGFALVGPHMPLDAHFALGNFIRDALRGGPVIVQGNGTPWRSYLYASDYAAACWQVLLNGQPGRAYNVGSSDAIQLEALAQLVASPLGLPVLVQGRAEAAGSSSRYIPSDLRIRDELGFRPMVGLTQAIQRTMDWYRM